MLFFQEFLKNLDQEKSEPTEEIIMYEETEDNESFPDDIIEYDAEESEEELFEVVDVEMKPPPKATKDHDMFLKAYLQKVDTKPVKPKPQIVQRKPLKTDIVQILKDEKYERKYVPIADTEEMIFEDDTMDYVEFSEESHTMVDQELEAAVETIDGSFKEVKPAIRQIYAREHNIMPATPAGISDAHLKYGSNRQVTIC